MAELEQLKSKFRRLAELRQERDITKKATENAEKEYRAYEAELMEEVESAGVRGTIKFDFDDLGTISFGARSTIYGRIVDPDAALDAFNQEAISEEMTGTKFESRRLNEYVRDRLENGQDLPDGVGFYERKFFSISVKS